MPPRIPRRCNQVRDYVFLPSDLKSRRISICRGVRSRSFGSKAISLGRRPNRVVYPTHAETLVKQMQERFLQGSVQQGKCASNDMRSIIRSLELVLSCVSCISKVTPTLLASTIRVCTCPLCTICLWVPFCIAISATHLIVLTRDKKIVVVSTARIVRQTDAMGRERRERTLCSSWIFVAARTERANKKMLQQ